MPLLVNSEYQLLIELYLCLMLDFRLYSFVVRGSFSTDTSLQSESLLQNEVLFISENALVVISLTFYIKLQ